VCRVTKNLGIAPSRTGNIYYSALRTRPAGERVTFDEGLLAQPAAFRREVIVH
jgi:hypothetical protein